MSAEPWIDFRKIRQSISIHGILAHYGIKLKHVQGPMYRGACPLPSHSSKSNYTFCVHNGKNIWACQSDSCAAGRGGRIGGNALDLVTAIERCSLREAAIMIAHWCSGPGAEGAIRMNTERSGSPIREKKRNQPLSFGLYGVDCSHPYLGARKISIQTADLFGVGFYDRPGIMHHRLVIPIDDANGDRVAYAGRSIDGAEPRYLFPKGFTKSIEVFNLRRAVATQKAAVVVVEGFFDTMIVHQAGYENVVALMGSSMSTSQSKLLTSSFAEIILLLDGDRAGRDGTERISEQLIGRTRVTAISLPNGLQPDQLAAAEIHSMLKQSH